MLLGIVIMKKVNYLWIVGLLMFAVANLCSCSEKEDELNPELFGLWKVVSDEGWEKVNGEIEYSWSQTGDEIEDKWFVEFGENGRFNMYVEYGDTLMAEEVGEVNWKYKNGSIYLSNPLFGGEYKWATVKSLTSSFLTLEEHYSETEDGNVYEDWALSVYEKVD